MSHGERDDGSWSRAFMASSGLGGATRAAGRRGSPEWHEASGADIAPQRFLELAHHRDVDVREALARREDCPMGVLASLAHDARVAVRVAAAANPRANAAVLEHLSQDRDPAVLKAVARNTATPSATRRRLAGHRRLEVRRAAERALVDAAGSTADIVDALPPELRERAGAEADVAPRRRLEPRTFAPRPTVGPREPRTPPPNGVAPPTFMPGGAAAT